MRLRSPARSRALPALRRSRATPTAPTAVAAPRTIRRAPSLTKPPWHVHMNAASIPPRFLPTTILPASSSVWAIFFDQVRPAPMSTISVPYSSKRTHHDPEKLQTFRPDHALNGLIPKVADFLGSCHQP